MHHRIHHTPDERHGPSAPPHSSPQGSDSPRWPPSHTQTPPCPRRQLPVMSCSPSGSSHKLHTALLFSLRAKEKVAGEKQGESERDREKKWKEEAGWFPSADLEPLIFPSQLWSPNNQLTLPLTPPAKEDARIFLLNRTCWSKQGNSSLCRLRVSLSECRQVCRQLFPELTCL